MEHAISFYRQLLECGASQDPLRSNSLNNLSKVSLARFRYGNDSRDLDEAIFLPNSIHRVVRPERGHWNRPHRNGVCLHKRILLISMRKTVSHTGLTCPVNFPDQQPLGLGLQHDGR